MSLSSLIHDYVNAATSGVWVVTHEPDEAEREIMRHGRQHEWKIAAWDAARGLRLPDGTTVPAGQASVGDPMAALRSVSALASPDGSGLLLLHNFHRFLNHPETIQTAFNQLVAGKRTRTFLVVLAPVVQLPPELEKLFVVVDHPLPPREQLVKIVEELTTEAPDDRPTGEALEQVLAAAAGLTRYEAEAALALSLIRHDTLRAEAIWEMKAQALRKNNLLTLHRGSVGFDSLGGMTSLKEFCQRALKPNRKVRPRGILLVGVPGTGKSAFAKCLGYETGRPTLLLDFGALYGSLVGATEQNVRQALRIAEAMAPCILFTDELEKGLAGIGSQGDSGVSTRLFGTLLTWLADHETDVFFIGTANDVSKLPPEFTRAERLDAVYFLDFPVGKDKDFIWELYRQQFDVPAGQSRPDDTDWTGAEIRACCRLSALLDVPLTQAARQVVPVAATAAEQIERLRNWASGRCLAAAAPGIYSRESSTPPRAGRRLNRPTSNN